MDKLMERFNEEVPHHYSKVVCGIDNQMVPAKDVGQFLQSAIEEVLRDIIKDKSVNWYRNDITEGRDNFKNEIIQKARDNWGIDLSDKE